MFDPELCSSQMLLVDYYRSAPDLVQFSQYWCPDTTMLDKIKVKNNNNNNIQISDQILVSLCDPFGPTLLLPVFRAH